MILPGVISSAAMRAPSLPDTFELPVPNGDFESGVASPWVSIIGTMAVSGSLASAPRSGSYCCRVGASAWARHLNKVDLTPEQIAWVSTGQYRVDFDAWQAGWSSDTDAGSINLVFYDSLGNRIAAVGSAEQTYGTNSWTYRGFTNWVVPPETAAIGIMINGRRQSGTNLDVYFDDIGPLVFRKRSDSKYIVTVESFDVTHEGALEGWTQVSGVLRVADSRLATPVMAWENSASGEAYRRIMIPPAHFADIDAGVAQMSVIGSVAGYYNQSDVGREYLEFYDESDVLIDTRVWSTTTAWKAPEHGQVSIFHANVPPGARIVRFGIVGTRSGSGNLDFGLTLANWIGLTLPL